MKEIQLTQGKVALVDDEDFEYLNQFKWFAHKSSRTFYAERHGKRFKKESGTMLKMHRVILAPQEGMEIDHIDHNGLNNQKSNLRICSKTQNSRNRLSSSSSGILGVSIRKYIGKHKISTRYVSYIQSDKITYNLGNFKTLEEAINARNDAAKKYHGEFANLNS